ncbi:hydrophobic amino acid uptake ABC-transporter [Microcystis aeruginosa NIES-3804]|uniref:Hydrophobic amino acid uptake ABC-transporter n=1 Tax=Microcystis aeruginosa NIES-3804 TaxID=2517783 RepID=A0A6H9G7E5_MICAE|nr:ABC transporter substrate-binding protein [Microcystis aeruginosa]GCL51111.1 hydrophobic amino acid uptake ABC-transporter [Microcystis aeruginosa NIES-3804]
MTTWQCDGIPKDGKTYPQATAGGHEPCENTAPDCPICGLPREAMDPVTTTVKTTVVVSPGGKTRVGQKSNWLLPFALIITALTAGLGGWSLLQMLIPKPDTSPVVQEKTPDKQTKATFVSNTAKNPDLFSQGEKILLNSTPDKEKGAAAFKREDWANAIASYQLAATPQANDPEGKIYYNNAKARQKGNQHTIAVVVPISKDPNSAKEILRGVARYQEEFNNSNPGNPLEIVIANDGGGLQSKAIADDLIQSGQVLAVIGHGIDPFSQKAIESYEKEGLAILSPLTTSVSQTGKSTLKTIPLKDKSQEVLGSYLEAVAKTLANYASKQENSPSVVLFYNSDSPYSQKLRDSFAKAIKQPGGQIVKEIDTTKANFNAKTAIDQARQAGAKVVFLALSKDGDRIDQAVAIAQESSGMLLLGGNELYTPDILIQGADSIDGLVLAVPWSFQATDPFAKDALKSWRGRVSWRTATAYDSMKVLGKAIAKSSDRATVVETLNRGITLQGSTTDFNIFNQVPLVRANRGNEGPKGSQYQFDPI